MDGEVSVWCVMHKMEVRRDPVADRFGTVHVRHGGPCLSTWYLVRSERQVDVEGALHALDQEAPR
jgi:hypothetical protein